MRKFLAILPMLAVLAGPVDLMGRDKHGKDYRGRHSAEEWNYRNDRRGHYPHDSNGDGVVSRREWPGNKNSFRKLDRNGDGVLSESDRRLRANPRYYDNYNDYGRYSDRAYDQYDNGRWSR